MSLRARALPLLLVCLAGCPARTRRVGEVTGPPEPPAVIVRPLEAADLADDPKRGLVLGSGGPRHARPVALAGRPHWLSVAAPRGEEDGWGSFWLIARPAGPRQVTDPIAPSTPSADGEAGGQDPDVDVPPNPNAPRRPDPPTGPELAGDEWKRALWGAQLAATSAVGKKPLLIELAAISRGDEVEPPPAATLAVAAIAALTGARVTRSSIVIAELEPDGSLAPVDDPVGQVQRALRRGARRIVLPLGGGTATPPGAAKPVDLLRLCRRSGAAAWLSPDLAAAYRSLARAPLPEPEPIAPADLALTRAERAALEKAYRRALERLAPAWPRLIEQQNRARLPPPLAALLAGAERGARRAERLRASGDRAAAYVRLTEAAALADAAMRLDQILRHVAEGEIDGARTELDGARPAPGLARLSPPGGASPVAIRDHLRASSLFALSAATWAWSEEADERDKQARAAIAAAQEDRARLSATATASAVAEGVAPFLIASARARMQADMIQDRVTLEPGGGPRFEMDLEDLRAVAAADASAAAAAVAALDAIGGSGADSSADPGATPSARSPEVMVAARMLALVGDDGDLVKAAGRARVSSERAPLLALSVARHAFDRAAEALARTRRLRTELNRWTGQPSAVGRPSRLRNALVLAERAARRQASAARVAVGSIPIGARLAYQAARGLARGDRLERVRALALYQVASAESRLAVLLALSEAVAPTSATGVVAARAGCPPSPSARPTCR